MQQIPSNEQQLHLNLHYHLHQSAMRMAPHQQQWMHERQQQYFGYPMNAAAPYHQMPPPQMFYDHASAPFVPTYHALMPPQPAEQQGSNNQPHMQPFFVPEQGGVSTSGFNGCGQAYPGIQAFAPGLNPAYQQDHQVFGQQRDNSFQSDSSQSPRSGNETPDSGVGGTRVGKKRGVKRCNSGEVKIQVACKLCPDTTFDSGHMYYVMTHLASHDASLRRYACSMCGFSAMRLDKMREHVTTKCIGGECEYRRDQQFTSKLNHWAKECFPDFVARIIAFHEQSIKTTTERAKRLKDANKNKKIECAKCGKQVKDTSGSRSHHAKTHTKLYRYRCTTCGKEGHMKDNINQHIKQHHHGNGEVEDQLNSEKVSLYGTLVGECFPSLLERKQRREEEHNEDSGFIGSEDDSEETS